MTDCIQEAEISDLWEMVIADVSGFHEPGYAVTGIKAQTVCNSPTGVLLIAFALPFSAVLLARLGQLSNVLKL